MGKHKNARNKKTTIAQNQDYQKALDQGSYYDQINAYTEDNHLALQNYHHQK